MPRRFARDPHYITARYPATCSAQDCEQAIAKGERAFYYPATRSLFAVPCGHAARNEADFEAADQDEAFYNGW